jgi:UDP-3-O-acyl-N-acetylglucosamine deacetylase
MGLIRGASLENAVCFDRERALNPEHFEFRGTGSRPPRTSLRREDG